MQLDASSTTKSLPLTVPLSQQHPHVLKVTQNQVETGPHHGTGEAASAGQALITVTFRCLLWPGQGKGRRQRDGAPVCTVQAPNGNGPGSDTIFPNLSLLLKDFNLVI